MYYGSVLSVSEFNRLLREIQKKKLFLPMYVAYSATQPAVIYVVPLLRSSKAEFTASNDNSPKYFFSYLKTQTTKKLDLKKCINLPLKRQSAFRKYTRVHDCAPVSCRGVFSL